MKKTGLALFALLLFVASCKNSEDSGSNENRVAKGNRVYGGTLKINETENFQTLYPLAITDVVSSDIGNQIYEGLVRFDPKDLSIKPCIAEKWEVDTSGLVYTFNLKKGVFFQDDPCFPEGKGREVKAQDFQYSYNLLCTHSADNASFNGSFQNRVKGADNYYEDSKSGKPSGNLDGVKVIDDYTLQITLEKPNSTFLYILANIATSVIPKEAVEQYGNIMKVGTGPFIFKELANSKDFVVLVRNDNYHRVDSFGNKLPYLDSVKISFLPTKKEELESFQKLNLDAVIGLPSESIREIVEQQIADFKNKPPKYILERTPEMATQFYEFNLNKNEAFKNLKVRKAFSYAIDRDKIIDEVLNGEAYAAGIYGITPPSFKGYDISKISGYSFDPEKARKLLAEAGYPDGKGFPAIKLELNSGGNKNTTVAFEIQKQLVENLNVNIDLEVVPFAKKIDDAKLGKADMFRSAWVANYPNPENFLWLFYSKTVPATLDQPSFPNTTRYTNPEFDRLYELGMTSRNQEESFKYFAEAEQIMINDAPVIVLWYDGEYKLVRSEVNNFHLNPMNRLDFTEIFIKPMAPAPAETQAAQ